MIGANDDRHEHSREVYWKLYTYSNYIRSDLGKLKSPAYNIINGNIDEHLTDTSVLLMSDVIFNSDIQEGISKNDGWLDLKEMPRIFALLIAEYCVIWMKETGLEAPNKDYWRRVSSLFNKLSAFSQ